MIKLLGVSKMINPAYVMLSGVLGGAIPFLMYFGNFPATRDKYALQFTGAMSYTTWVFLLSVLFSGISIILIPGWKVCRDLYSSAVQNATVKPRKVIGVLFISTMMYALVLVSLFALAGRVVPLPVSDFIGELNNRFVVVYVYSVLGFMPLMFSIILINYIAEHMLAEIPDVIGDEKRTADFIQRYLNYRNILQVCLVTAGVILSLNPIITTAYVYTWKEVGIFTDATFPSQGIMIYGLIITLVLILIYVPTYFNLTNVGRELRDVRYPFPDQLDDLKSVMDKRKTLDELLQTNIGITENLKNGIFTLSPLVTGLIGGLLRFKS